MLQSTCRREQFAAFVMTHGVMPTSRLLRRSGGPAHQSGYTLFELLVVLSIVTLALSLSGFLYSRSNTSLQGQLISKTVASELRKTRSIAIADNSNRRWGQSDLAALLNENSGAPDKLSFTFTPNVNPPDNHSAFVFYADGSANGGVITVVAPKRSWEIHIGLSGRITIHEADTENI